MFVALGAAIALPGQAQTPDLLNALDAGGRAMGLGGGINAAGADTLSATHNPAGLAYVRERSMSVVYRNLPRSRTDVMSDFRNPRLDTMPSLGSRSFTHAGFVIPLGRGTLGVAYTTGGYIDDLRVNRGNLAGDGGTSITNYRERLMARVDFLTVAYGTASARAELTWGAGLVVASARVENEQNYTILRADGSTLDQVSVDNSGTGTGIGLIAGVQYMPPGAPNLSIGLSVRSPIDLHGNGVVAGYYDRVPGRVSLGAAFRMDNLRGGRDFAVLGAQVDGYFMGQRDKVIVRRRQIVTGAGIEYNYTSGGARIPLRVGFQAVPSGGPGFAERNSLTFGIGYRPFAGPMSVDVNFASAFAGRGTDMAVQLTYRLD
jgi:hypothetical protein